MFSRILFIFVQDAMHANYYEITSRSHYGAGVQRGELFRDRVRAHLEKRAWKKDWEHTQSRARKNIKEAQEFFPRYMEELQGFADACNISLIEMYAIAMELDTATEHCTAVITNRGMLIGFNEDSEDAIEDVCVLKRTIRNKTVFEIGYKQTLGGNSISINSSGVIQCINSVHHKRTYRGVPGNLIARWLSDTAHPKKAEKELQKIPVQDGYSYTLLSKKHHPLSIESTGKYHHAAHPDMPFVHTNHYLSDLKKYEDRSVLVSTFDRFERASALVKPDMTVAEMKRLLGDTSRGSVKSIRNEDTIASVVVDVSAGICYVRLESELRKGYVSYTLEY